MKKQISTIVTIISIFIVSAASADMASAVWGVGGSVGICGNNPSPNHPSFTCATAGTGWAYFKYLDKDKAPGGLPFGPTRDSIGGRKIISAECEKYGGFYHYGYTNYKTGTWSFDNTWNWNIAGAQDRQPDYAQDYYGNWYPYYIDYGHPDWYVDLGAGWNPVSMGSPTIRGGVDDTSQYDLRINDMNAGLDELHNGGKQAQVFWIYRDGRWSQYAELQEFTPRSTAKERYYEYINAEYGPNQDTINANNHWDFNGSDLNWFCWGPDMDQPKNVNGRTIARVNDQDFGDNTNIQIDTEDGNFKIQFEHQLARGEDNSDKDASATWSTEVRAWDSGGKTPTEGTGTARNGTKNLTKTDTSWNAVVEFEEETINGTLLPGETKTFCQKMNYPSTIRAGSDGSTYTQTQEVCVTVRRTQNAKCGDKNYNVSNGENWGNIIVYQTGHDKKETGFISTGDKEVVAWAKQKDMVAFTEQMCETAELSNQYHEHNKDISYRINATNKDYMKNLSDTTAEISWNNSGIKGRANLNKDIWGGSTYQRQTNSPESNQRTEYYKIESGHLGTSFQQSLHWTDLRIEDGKIDAVRDGSKEASATAIVNVPYNYRLQPTVEIGTTQNIAAGTESNTFTPKITVEERINKPVNGEEKYATDAKLTKYQVISFSIKDNVNVNDVGIGKRFGIAGNTGNPDDGYFNASGTADLAKDYCKTTYGKRGFLKNYNNSYYSNSCNLIASGEVTPTSGNDNKIEAPISINENTPLGYKACVVLAVWPADSHNNIGEIDNDLLEGDAMQTDPSNETGTRLWRISQPSCTSVSKKPSFQLYNYGAYAENEINTATYDRNYTTNGSTTRRSYGSWSEFEVVSGGLNRGLASGAALWGGIQTQSENDKHCYVSALSFTNSECHNETVGNANISNNFASNPQTLYEKIKTRYTQANPQKVIINKDSTKPSTLTLEGACRYDTETHKYEQDPRFKENNGGKDGDFNCLDNGTYYTRVYGDAQTNDRNKTSVTCYSTWWGQIICHETGNSNVPDMYTSTDGEHSSNTYVTHVDGTLYINQNFFYGAIDNRGNGVAENFENIAQIPQTIFIAKDIKISNNVTHLDAWLIAENSIDTCYPGEDEITGDPIKVSVSNCDSQLTVTGPIIAKNVKLNRTAGSEQTLENGRPSPKAANAAELFKISPATYLWSYNQSLRYSQAIMTYSKELPPRF